MQGRGRILIYGFGNPGRLDDGLGPALAAAIEPDAPEGVRVDANYQLALEDVEAVAAHDVSLFVDASVSGPAPFSLTPVVPDRAGLGFSTHSVSAGTIVALAERISGRAPVAYMLGIRGYEWNEFGERLSPRAQQNLKAAVRLVRAALSANSFTAFLGSHVTTQTPSYEGLAGPGA